MYLSFSVQNDYGDKWCLNELQFYGREIANSLSKTTPFAGCYFDNVESDLNKVRRLEYHDYATENWVPYYHDGAVIKCELNAGNSLNSLNLKICDIEYVGTNANFKIMFETWNGDKCSIVTDGK